MSCLAWNCHGLGIPRAKKELEDLIQARAPLIVFLSKTWADKEKLERLKYNVKFVGLFVVNSQDRGGGLALLWQHGIQVWVDSFSRFHIDAIIQGGSHEAWRFTGFYGEPDCNVPSVKKKKKKRSDCWFPRAPHLTPLPITQSTPSFLLLAGHSHSCSPFLFLFQSTQHTYTHSSPSPSHRYVPHHHLYHFFRQNH